MALRNVRNYKFFSDAIIEKFRNPDLKSFKGIPFGPQTNSHSIFGKIYATFRELNSKGLNLHQYLNIEDRSVLENLYRNLKSDTNLKFLDSPVGTLGDPRFELSDQYYAEQPPEITEAQQAEQIPPAGTTGGAGGIPSLPSSPVFSSGPGRMIYNAPAAAQTPKPEIVIANKSGVVTEKPPSEFHVTDSTGNIQATYSKEPIPATPQSKLVTPGIGPGDASKLVIPGRETGDPSKLVSARSDGTVFGKHPVQPPGFLKNLGSNTQIFAKRNLARAGRGIFGMAKTGLESANPFLGRAGNSLVRGLTNIANPGGFGGIGNRGILGRFSRFGRGGGGKTSVTKKAGANWVKRAIILFFLGSVLVGGLVISNPTGDVPIPGAPPVVSSDISSCEFTRAGQSAPLKSSSLASYISQASARGGVPAAVTAGVAMIESPSFTPIADDSHDAIKNNYYYSLGPGSETKAVGLMQISTGRTPTDKGIVDHCTGLFDSGLIQQVADTVGKQLKGGKEYYCVNDVDERVRRFCQFSGKVYIAGETVPPTFRFFPQTDNDDKYLNLCKITDNLAAGVAMLNAKIGGGSWNNETDVKNAVKGYYGQCGYTQNENENEIEYSYCDEVWNDYQNCQTQTATHPTPPPPDSSDLRTSLISQFGVTMDGFDNDHLKWTWEKLWDISNTRFITFVKGSVIKASNFSEQVGCPGSSVAVYLNQYPEEIFKYALIHELGHVIRNCPVRSANFYIDHMNAYFTEKGVTYYAKNAAACTGSDNLSEDYAETIARYLNPNTTVQILRGKPPSCIPPISETVNLKINFPLHYNVAKSILGDY